MRELVEEVEEGSKTVQEVDQEIAAPSETVPELEEESVEEEVITISSVKFPESMVSSHSTASSSLCGVINCGIRGERKTKTFPISCEVVSENSGGSVFSEKSPSSSG